MLSLRVHGIEPCVFCDRYIVADIAEVVVHSDKKEPPVVSVGIVVGRSDTNIISRVQIGAVPAPGA